MQPTKTKINTSNVISLDEGGIFADSNRILFRMFMQILNNIFAYDIKDGTSFRVESSSKYRV